MGTHAQFLSRPYLYSTRFCIPLKPFTLNPEPRILIPVLCCVRSTKVCEATWNNSNSVYS